MVARPGDIPTWATDANYPAGAEDWNGTPTRVEPDPSDEATGLVPKTRPPAQWLNWLFGLVTDWIAFLGETAIARVDTLPIADATFGNDPPTGAVLWVIEGSGASGDAPRARPLATADHARAWYAIRVPTGRTITKLQILIATSAVRAGAARWQMTAWQRVWDVVPAYAAPAVTQLGAVVDDGGANGLAIMEISGLATVVDNDHTDYYVEVTGPTNPAGDHLLVCRVHSTGPRVPD